MAGTNPSPTASIEKATRKNSAERIAMETWLAERTVLTREQKRLVAQVLGGSRLGKAFSQICSIWP